MSLTSNIILRLCYIRIGAWQGNSQELNAQYNADTNFEQVVTESFPPQSMYDALLGVENEIATAVASNESNILRSSIGDIVSVTNGERIPDHSDTGTSSKIIGVLGQVRDAALGREMTPGLNEDEIRAIYNGPSGLFKSGTFSYVIRPPRLYITTIVAEIDCCVFDWDARKAVIDANGALLFQQCQNAYFDGLMASLKNQDASYTELSNQYVGSYQAWLAAQRPVRDIVGEAHAA